MSVWICDIVAFVCIALLVLQLVLFGVNVFLRGRAGRITYIRNFRKGRCVVVYFTALPLYIVGYLWIGESFLESVFLSLHRMINLVVLKYEFTAIGPVMEMSSLFMVAVYLNFFMVGANAVLFGLSLFGQQLSYALNALKMWLVNSKGLYLFGVNASNESILQSSKDYRGVILGSASQAKRDEYYIKKISYFSPMERMDFCSYLVKKSVKGRVTAIINTEDEEQNILLCNKLINAIAALDGKIEAMNNLHVYVFGDPKYAAIYADLLKQAKGCLNYVNKYQLVAIDFINRFPITRFMDERHIDYDSACIKPDVDVNVVMIGFGNINRQIFLTSVANNQLITKKGDEVVLKRANYYIFDKEGDGSDKNLNHSYYRYKNRLEGLDQTQYLPLPQLPANEAFVKLDVNSSDFYGQIKQRICGGKNDVNYVIIAFGSDLENIDMAQKLIQKRKEWGKEETAVFVKCNDKRIAEKVIKEKRCYCIGDKNSEVYDVNKIVCGSLEQMAKRRNEIYDIEYSITHEGKSVTEQFLQSSKQRSRKSWYLSKTQFERDSSLYCCLSLRLKLHLLGLDYCLQSESGEEVDEKTYFDCYCADDMPNTDFYNQEIEGKKIVRYGSYFKPSKRKNLAILEHYRWNSFMISIGMIPATVEQILNETTVKGDGRVVFTNGKNYQVRRHGNLTTFEGLVQFAELVAKRDNVELADADVIKYDYQLLDDAYWLLKQSGMKMIKKKNVD